MPVMKEILKKPASAMVVAVAKPASGRKPTTGLGANSDDTAADKVKREAFGMQIADPRARRAAYGRMATSLNALGDDGLAGRFDSLDANAKASFLLNWMIDPSFAKSRVASTVLTKEETDVTEKSQLVATAWQLEQLDGEGRCERFDPWSQWMHPVGKRRRMIMAAMRLCSTSL